MHLTVKGTCWDWLGVQVLDCVAECDYTPGDSTYR
jgi:hypothetical protein